MTRDQDIERVLDWWFTEGPTQMPNRFLDDTLDRIDRAPQRRLARLQTRLPAMHPDLRFAAAAVVLAAAGLGAAVLTQTDGGGSASPAGSGLLPTSGQVEWRPVGTRQHPTPGGKTDQLDLDIVIGPTTITVFESHGDVINSAVLVGSDRLDLRMLNNPVVSWPVAGGVEPRTVWHCQVGDAGTYTFSLSSGDRHLTLTPVNDACAERATILAGDWTRTDLGDLAPGRHVSQALRPFDGGTSGQFSYTVPTGWAESDETASGISVRRSGASDEGAVRLLSNVVPVSNSPGAGCAASAADVQGTPAAIATWLATRLVVSAPTPVTIGGLSGVMVDVAVNPSLVTCPDLFVDFTHSLGAGLSGERRARYVLLARGDGQILLISIEASDKATWDALVADAMPIVQSFEFTR
jgi:hypothetical protein